MILATACISLAVVVLRSEPTSETQIAVAAASPRDSTPAPQETTPAPAVVPFTRDEAKDLQQAWAKHVGVPVEYTNSMGIRFRLVPPGEFMMGTAEEQLPLVPEENAGWRRTTATEVPPHRIHLSRAFYVAESEVTQEQYAAVTGGNPSHFSAAGRGSDTLQSTETGRHPVEDVSWLDAVLFCNALSRLEEREPFYRIEGADVRLVETSRGYRLPTEAEWEFACRAGSSGQFCFGDDQRSLRAYGTYQDNSGGRSWPVMRFKPNAFGLFDMHGNVWEMCFDWYDPGYYSLGTMTNPQGPDRGVSRVHRGGSWDNPSDRCRSAQRSAGAPESHSMYRGFRVVRSIDPARD